MKISLDTLLNESNSFLQEELKLGICKSNINFYSENQWEKFTSINNLNKNSSGVYLPHNNQAYVNKDSPTIIADVFHELYGHGIFCEHSKLGLNIVDMARNNSNVNDYIYNEEREDKKWGIYSVNWGNYEGFAVWLEDLLCKKFGFKGIFNEKIKLLHNNYDIAFQGIKDYETRFGRFAMMSQLGFPKFYTPDIIINSLKNYMVQDFEKVEFIILGGSQKPYSDIDLFMVSDLGYINHDQGWLDIYGEGKDRFRTLMELLDIAVTERVFNGELIYGDKNEFERIKYNCKNQKIPYFAIEHNYNMAEIRKKMPSNIQRDKYIQNYMLNVEALKNGFKSLTVKNLENFIQKI